MLIALIQQKLLCAKERFNAIVLHIFQKVTKEQEVMIFLPMCITMALQILLRFASSIVRIVAMTLLLEPARILT